MKKKTISIIKLFFLGAIISFHNFVFAQGDLEDPGGNTDQNQTGESIRLGNPLEGGGINNIPTLIEEILKIVITIGVPIVAIAIIYTGFLFVAAQGNPEKLKKAKDSLIYVVIGAAILLGAYAIAEGIGSTVAAIRGN